jgi:GntR family transcriptional regulator/MocR family aminotransferase
MAKRDTFQDLSLDPPQAGHPLWHWLYSQVRGVILNGRLRPGMRMPSTRNLAKQYSLSRGTVVAAFEHLQSEGYVETQVGAGSFVAANLPNDVVTNGRKEHPVRPAVRAGLSRAQLANRGRVMAQSSLHLPASYSLGRAFRSHEPALDLFPVQLWNRVSSRVLRHAPRTLYGHGEAIGYRPLRRAIAEYLGAARGVRCDADQILITSGAQQALDLVIRLLMDAGDAAWVEDPGYPGIVSALRAGGARIIPVPVDRHGLQVDVGVRRGRKAKLAYVTPANQFPLGYVMSIERRLSLLNWALKEGAWIVEDDYDSEYRYSGRPVAALQGLDRNESVIYVGTFTKMLFPSLRIGFLVLPSRIVDAFAAAKASVDRHAPTLDQAILSEFILEGHFGHHVRRMRQIYAERIGILVDACKRKLHGLIDVIPAPAGMRTVGWLPNDLDDSIAAQSAIARGLEVAALSRFAVKHRSPNGLVLGFAACNEAEIRRGVDVLAEALRGCAYPFRSAASIAP